MPSSSASCVEFLLVNQKNERLGVANVSSSENLKKQMGYLYNCGNILLNCLGVHRDIASFSCDCDEFFTHAHLHHLDLGRGGGAFSICRGIFQEGVIETLRVDTRGASSSSISSLRTVGWPRSSSSVAQRGFLFLILDLMEFKGPVRSWLES